MDGKRVCDVITGAAVMRCSSFIRLILRGMVLGQVMPIAYLKHKTEMVDDTS